MASIRAPRHTAPFTPGRITALFATPALAIFLTSNLVNAGNMAFNLLFSRWMGPEAFGDLTVLLTLKLALLGMLGAFQSAVSQRLADADARDLPRLSRKLGALNRTALVVGTLGLPLFALALFQGHPAKVLGLQSDYLLLMLLATMPIAASMSLLRGVALGRMRVSKIVLSSLVEVAVRLFGAILAWQLSFGFEGVVFAIVASIIAGWIVLTDLLPKRTLPVGSSADLAASLAMAALPFGVLYLAQILALDGDIFFAKAYLTAQDTGYVAALLLFQRIQFFACFALASVLLPSVVAAARAGHALAPSIAPVLCLFLISATVFLSAVLLHADWLITTLVGAEYARAAQGLLPAAIAAIAFTASFLIATFLAALGDRNGIWATVSMAFGQLLFMAMFTENSSVTFITILNIKCIAQILLAIGLVAYAGLQIRRLKTFPIRNFV